MDRTDSHVVRGETQMHSGFCDIAPVPHTLTASLTLACHECERPGL